MTKDFCDICGKEITDWSKASEFKLKKRVYSWHERWWEKLTVHTECWIKLCDSIKHGQEKNNVCEETKR